MIPRGCLARAARWLAWLSPLPPPTNEDVEEIAARIVCEIRRLLARRDDDAGDDEPDALAYAQAEAVLRLASIGGTAAWMVLSVGDAVRWMTSGDLGVSWACFNDGGGSENFPLYFYQAEELAIAFGVLPPADAPSSVKVDIDAATTIVCHCLNTLRIA